MLVLTGMLVLCFSAASQAAPKQVLKVFGSPGAGDGQFSAPTGGVAVRQSTGDVYVVDIGNERVQRFDADGVYLGQFGTAGSGDGQFSLGSSAGVAINQTTGQVYVADSANNRVERFSAAGVYEAQFGTAGAGNGELNSPAGVAVDATGRVLVADSANNRVERFSAAGVYQDQLGASAPNPGSGDGELSFPVRVAVDSTGLIYVLDSGNSRIQRFTGAGAFDTVFASDQAAAPFDLAVNRTTDTVLTFAYTPDFSLQAIFELDAAGALLQTHAGGSGIGAAGGLDVRGSSGRIYQSDAYGSKVYILDDVAPPTAAIDPATAVGAHGATFNGRVDPVGSQTNFHFEYSSDGGTTWTPTSDGDSGAGSGEAPVTTAVGGLEANKGYRVRLVAAKPFNAGAATSAEQTFTTQPDAPLVHPLAAGNRSDTAAWLGGQVDPQNSASTYYVEYGASSAYGSRTADADAGSGNDFTSVRQLVSGLQPQSTYHFRVVATNQAGATNGPDRTFTTNAALPTAPAGRAYEMVSPLDKNGGNVNRNLAYRDWSTSGVATDGQAVAYSSEAQFADIESGARYAVYRSSRTASGWRTNGIDPPFAPAYGAPLGPHVQRLSPDLHKVLAETNAELVPGANAMLGGDDGLYLRDDSSGSPSYALMSQPFAPLQPFQLGPADVYNVIATTPDFRHVVFTARARQLTPDARPSDYSSSGFGGDRSVYEWTDGHIRFVSKLPDGTPAQYASAGIIESGFDSQAVYPGDHVISDDGRRIFFTANTGANALFVRENGAVTRPISVSQRAGDSPEAADGVFQAAKAADGSQVLFTSSSMLTDDSHASFQAPDLYLWNADAPSGTQLTDLSAQDPSGGGVRGVVAATDDLTHVYFAATGVLAVGATSGKNNLYLWTHGGAVRFVTTLGDGDGDVWGSARDVIAGGVYRDARISADGSRLALGSTAQLTSQDTGGHRQVYLYDANDDQLVCVSCGSTPAHADARMYTLDPGELVDATVPFDLPRNLSADGGRLLFETSDALVPEDINGKSDVYVWEHGAPHLISSGQGSSDSLLVGAGENGDDVFFTTRERLVAADSDDHVDVYDARVGGGFAEQQLPPDCDGDECQGASAARPQLDQPASTQAAAGAEQAAEQPVGFSFTKLTAAQRAALAAGRTVTLKASASIAGRISASARAKLGKRTAIVASGAAGAVAGRRIELVLRLSKAARTRLARQHKLTVKLSVSFDHASGVKSQSFTLLTPKRRASGKQSTYAAQRRAAVHATSNSKGR
ncbi:MAG TPA: hypothetical protein VLJ42_00405 [Solirubrobacteraceae bacterium]|nr:hypothetical protein [Solirubrobacteraceae bacterium]